MGFGKARMSNEPAKRSHQTLGWLRSLSSNPLGLTGTRGLGGDDGADQASRPACAAEEIHDRKPSRRLQIAVNLSFDLPPLPISEQMARTGQRGSTGRV